MADVQPDKFTKIASELLEVMPLYKFNATQLRLIMVVWRYTYGFKRKEHEISVSFLVKATGITKRQVQKEVTNLINNKVLNELQKANFNQSRKIGFNKDYDSWLVEHSRAKEQQVNNNAQVNDSTPQQVNDSTPQQVNDSTPKIDNFIDNSIDKEEEDEDALVLFDKNIARLSEIVKQQLMDWIDDMGEEIIVAAIKLSAEHGATTYAYVKKVLIDWYKNNLRDIEQVRNYELRKLEKKKVTPFKPKQAVGDIDWDNI